MSVRRVDVGEPGYGRRRAGKGFTYLDCGGARLTDAADVARIKALAIPPAWTDVWICPDPRGHIQATGLDDRGRRQYRYHDEWRTRRDRAKHDRMLELARALPRLRRRVRRDLKGPGLGRDRVLACAVRMLQLGLFRVGGEAYTGDGSFGLATLRKGHVRARGDELRFDYTGKGGQRRVVTICDDEVVEVVRALKRRRRGGPELLAYKDDRGRWVDVRSSDINDYLQEVLGGEFTAKDFRTWTATVLAAVRLAVDEDVGETAGRARAAVARAMRDVARQLGNTAAVARGSYVDPRVVELFEDGATVGDALRAADVRQVAETMDDGESDTDGDAVVPVSLRHEVHAAVADLIDGARPS